MTGYQSAPKGPQLDFTIINGRNQRPEIGHCKECWNIQNFARVGCRSVEEIKDQKFGDPYFQNSEGNE